MPFVCRAPSTSEPKRKEVTRGWRKLLFHNLCSSSNIITVIKSRKWVGQVAFIAVYSCLFSWATRITRMGGLRAKIHVVNHRTDAHEPDCCSTGGLFTPALPSPLSLCPAHQCGPFFDPTLHSPRHNTQRPRERWL
jgi:hypothetical protein